MADPQPGKEAWQKHSSPFDEYGRSASPFRPPDQLGGLQRRQVP